jgi:integrase
MASQGSVYLRGNTYWVSFQNRAWKQVRKTAGRGATEKQAEALLKRLKAADKAAERRGDLDAKQKAAIWTTYTKWRETELPTLKSRHATANHAAHVEPYINKGQEWGQLPEIAHRIVADGLSKGLKAATINRRLAVLIRLANLAYRWGWTDIQHSKRVAKLREPPGRTFFLSLEQVEALAEACTLEGAADLIRLAAWTGLRLGELMRLKPDMVRNGAIVLPSDTKTGKARTVPVPAHILPILARVPVECSQGQLRAQWIKARAAVGLEHIRIHDLRHTYASWLVQSGASLRTVQELLGHTSAKCTVRYTHLDSRSLRGAVAKMAEWNAAG